MKKIKVGAVSYLNTKPLLYGMQTEEFLKNHVLVLDYPSRIAENLQTGLIDVGFIPVAELNHFPGYQIVSDYCIAADGNVGSVCLFSEKPVQELTRIYLDYQSRSSVALLKILLKEHWKIEPELIETDSEIYRAQIAGTTGALVIGDRAFEQRAKSTFIYDLAGEWRTMTGLPFVFAVWASTKPMDADWIQQFNAANALGLQQLDFIADQQNYPMYNLHQYYTQNICYLLNDERRKGLQKFLTYLAD